MQPLLVVGREQEQINHNLPLRLGQAGLHGRAEQLIAGPALRVMVRGVDRVTLRLDELSSDRETQRADQISSRGAGTEACELRQRAPVRSPWALQSSTLARLTSLSRPPWPGSQQTCREAACAREPSR
jgi:hypothetical protein